MELPTLALLENTTQSLNIENNFYISIKNVLIYRDRVVLTLKSLDGPKLDRQPSAEIFDFVKDLCERGGESGRGWRQARVRTNIARRAPC